MARAKPTPDVDLDQTPTQGGSYTRDPATGALTRTEGQRAAVDTAPPAAPTDVVVYNTPQE